MADIRTQRELEIAADLLLDDIDPEPKPTF